MRPKETARLIGQDSRLLPLPDMQWLRWRVGLGQFRLNALWGGD